MSRVAGEKQRSAVPAKRAAAWTTQSPPLRAVASCVRQALTATAASSIVKDEPIISLISDDGYAVVLLGDNNISDFRQLGPAHHGSVLQERVDLLEQADAVVVHPKSLSRSR